MDNILFIPARPGNKVPPRFIALRLWVRYVPPIAGVLLSVFIFVYRNNILIISRVCFTVTLQRLGEGMCPRITIFVRLPAVQRTSFV